MELISTWRPFSLVRDAEWARHGADALDRGVDKRAWYDERFGAATVATFEPRLRAAFARAGVAGEYSLDGRTGPTSRGHRLACMAEIENGRETQDKFMESMFSRYFLGGETPCARETLLAACADAGMDVARCERVLDDDDLFADVVAEQKKKYASRVSGVPHFIISNDAGRKIELGGAQPPEAFADAFSELLGVDVDIE